MIYRDFGKTGKKISALGFGCMRLPEIKIGEMSEAEKKAREGLSWYEQQKDDNFIVDEEKAIPMLKAAYDAGVNYFDTAQFYCHFKSQATLGKAVKLMDRSKVMIATKIPPDEIHGTSDFRRMLELQLKLLDMDYIDFYHLHGINKDVFDNKIMKFGLKNEVQKALDEGLIKHISFSFHGDVKDVPYVVETFEMFSSALLQYNLLDRSHEENIDYLANKGIGVVVMGPIGGGRLSMPSALSEKLLGTNFSTPELALRFVLGNKNVSCVTSGMGDMSMLEGNLKVANLEVPMTDEDFRKAALMMEELKKFSDLYCTGCNYCLPCPKDIDIPHVFNAYTHHNVYGLSDQAKNMWNENRGAAVSECIDCGVCNEKCPQQIKVAEKLKEVAGVLSGL
ncbi:MAG: aldo/keto reductase [Defluviitaleaceae bacterium]|nr:aldo/keto reductase [Defluviitaleaceae bacterium]